MVSFLHQMQWHKPAHTIDIHLNQVISTSIWRCLITGPIIIWEKANEENLHYTLSMPCVACEDDVWWEVSGNNYHNVATNQSYSGSYAYEYDAVDKD